MHRLRQITGPIGLRCKTAGAHPQETEVPVDHVKDIGTQSDGTNKDRRSQPSGNCHVNHPQQGYGDIGNDIWECQSEDLPIHRHKNNLKTVHLRMNHSNFRNETIPFGEEITDFFP